MCFRNLLGTISVVSITLFYLSPYRPDRHKTPKSSFCETRFFCTAFASLKDSLFQLTIDSGQLTMNADPYREIPLTPEGGTMPISMDNGQWTIDNDGAWWALSIVHCQLSIE